MATLITLWYGGFSSGPPSTVKTKIGLTRRSTPDFVVESNSGRSNNFSKSKAWLNAVDEECLPDLIAIYVGPE